MSIEYHVLGAAGRDNALLVYVHTGQANHRLLFDCGDGCLTPLPFAEIQRIDHLFFSHLHMDHIGGFDAFFRTTYNRTARPNVLWGPPESARILHHRLQGFLWNLTGDKQACWRVGEVGAGEIRWTRFELHEAFRTAYPDGVDPSTGTLLASPEFTVEAITLDHHVPSLGYLVREGPRLNVDPVRLGALGLPRGAWMKALKSALPDDAPVEVDGAVFALGELRAALLATVPGDAVAYLTDFHLNAVTLERLAGWLRGCKAIVCESAYRAEDAALAEENAHLTTVQAAEIAHRAGAGKLVLIHLSDRYPPSAWPALLAEARAVFPRTEFPRAWGIDG
jgi:ribonuclease Z